MYSQLEKLHDILSWSFLFDLAVESLLLRRRKISSRLKRLASISPSRLPGPLGGYQFHFLLRRCRIPPGGPPFTPLRRFGGLMLRRVGVDRRDALSANRRSASLSCVSSIIPAPFGILPSLVDYVTNANTKAKAKIVPIWTDHDWPPNGARFPGDFFKMTSV